MKNLFATIVGMFFLVELASANCSSPEAVSFQKAVLREVVMKGDVINEKIFFSPAEDASVLQNHVYQAVGDLARYRSAGCTDTDFEEEVFPREEAAAAEALLMLFDQVYGNEDGAWTEDEQKELRENPGTQIVLEIAGW